MSLRAADGLLSCPVCAADLGLTGALARCPSGHSFDVARQGYLNLLGRGQPANADTVTMLAARARVHAGGLFDPVVAELLAQLPGGARACLEVGAGNAHYLAAVVDAHPLARGVALDVSIAAARAAARTHPRVASVVADVWRGLPVRTASVDAVLCVFAPRNLAEFQRVLRPEGRLLVVTPTEHHLASLRRRYGLLAVDPAKDERLHAQASDRFEVVATTTNTHRADAGADQVRDLIAMGPNAFHGPAGDVEPQPVDVSVRLTVFRPLRPAL